MRERVNKPRVFLSHSSLDKDFIEKLARDLRKCQIDPWLDTEEIRDGRPWLKVIFEDGIPTCDAVIVYITENSLNSKMVAKEMDATIVEELAESGITILPYVSQAELRGRLRPDIRSLQCREWNDSNYSEILPSVVAEIWRSYMERNFETATLNEKNRRLELELEMKRMQENYEASVFSPSEEKEFQYIYGVLDQNIETTFNLHALKFEGMTRTTVNIGKDSCQVNLLAAILNYLNTGTSYFDLWEVGNSLAKVLHKERQLPDLPGVGRSRGEFEKSDLIIELKTYGLIRPTKRERFNRLESTHEFTEKMYRFKFWLEYNNYPIKEIIAEYKCLLKESQNEAISST